MVERLKERTSKSFGFEWSKFRGVYEAYRNNFWDIVYPCESRLLER